MTTCANNNNNKNDNNSDNHNMFSLEMGSDAKSSSKAQQAAGGGGNSSTVPTCFESSEEFTLSAELSEDAPMLQLSGLYIVNNDENDGDRDATSQQQQQQQQQQQPASPKRLAPTAEGKGVHFDDNITYITEEDLAVRRAAAAAAAAEGTKKSKKKKKQQDKAENDDALLAVVPPEDIWWTAEELESLELNAMYMVKECQQYQEEVVCTVLYNKAFLTAANLAKTITEEKLEDLLRKDIGLHAQNLESWTAVGQSRRGLENMVSEKGVVDAMQCRKAVLQYQQELRLEQQEPSTTVVGDTATLSSSTAQQRPSSSTTTSSPLLSSQQAELLAERYQDASRTARIMARMMGQADCDSLAKADEDASQGNSLPEPPGTFDNYDYAKAASDGARVSRAADRVGRGSRLLKPIKKAVGAVFRRQGSAEVHKRRIMRLQQKQMEEAANSGEPPKRPSQEFRRSFLENLEYGEQ